MCRSSIPILIITLILSACGDRIEERITECQSIGDESQQYALLASRIKDLEELKKLIRLKYVKPSDSQSSKMVELTYCSRLDTIVSILKEGISQTEVVEASEGGLWGKVEVLFSEPSIIQNRKHFKDIYLLSRRRYDIYGYGDVAFYDLALESSRKIISKPTAFLKARDSSEKGFINSFNHITAQSIITSIYSRKIADLVADVHERYNMPELIEGNFKHDQLTDSNNNPVDNYVDMINNEIGQVLGMKLKEKYNIELHQPWSSTLLTNYLNDLQKFYSRAFQIRCRPFHRDEALIIRFTKKLNTYHKLKYKL